MQDPLRVRELQKIMNKVPIRLIKPYITKKIEASAFKTVLASTYQTAYRLYLITNGIKEIQNFYEATHPEYYILATVKTIAAPAGEARRQVWNVKHLAPLLNNKPRFNLRCSVTEKSTNKIKYRSEISSINESVIYNHIQGCIEDLEKILKKHDVQ
jgi:hypothetical protein